MGSNSYITYKPVSNSLQILFDNIQHRGKGKRITQWTDYLPNSVSIFSSCKNLATYSRPMLCVGLQRKKVTKFKAPLLWQIDVHIYIHIYVCSYICICVYSFWLLYIIFLCYEKCKLRIRNKFDSSWINTKPILCSKVPEVWLFP